MADDAYVPYPILAPLSSFGTLSEQNRHLRIEDAFYEDRAYLRPEPMTLYVDGLVRVLEAQTESRAWASTSVAALASALRAEVATSLLSDDLAARQVVRDMLDGIYYSLE